MRLPGEGIGTNLAQQLRRLSSLGYLPAASSCETANADIGYNREGKHSRYRPSVPVKTATRLNLEPVPKAEDLIEGDWSCEVQIKRQTEQRRYEGNCCSDSWA
jgi:hypothetical protein